MLVRFCQLDFKLVRGSQFLSIMQDKNAQILDLKKVGKTTPKNCSPRIRIILNPWLP